MSDTDGGAGLVLWGVFTQFQTGLSRSCRLSPLSCSLMWDQRLDPVLLGGGSVRANEVRQTSDESEGKTNKPRQNLWRNGDGDKVSQPIDTVNSLTIVQTLPSDLK